MITPLFKGIFIVLSKFLKKNLIIEHTIRRKAVSLSFKGKKLRINEYNYPYKNIKFYIVIMLQ
jgi:hypothetical protein